MDAFRGEGTVDKELLRTQSYLKKKQTLLMSKTRLRKTYYTPSISRAKLDTLEEVGSRTYLHRIGGCDGDCSQYQVPRWTMSAVTVIAIGRQHLLDRHFRRFSNMAKGGLMTDSLFLDDMWWSHYRKVLGKCFTW